MTIAEFVGLLEQVPFYVYVIVAFIVVLIFGDKKVWEYEVKFPLTDGFGRGEVEIECFKKKGATIEVEMKLEPEYNDKAVEIYLNNKLVLTIPAAENRGSYFSYTRAFLFAEPKEGSIISVVVGGEVRLSGPLVLD